MSLEWIVTGIILLGGMTVCGISLWIKRRRESQIDTTFFNTEIQSDLANIKKDDESKPEI